MNRALAEKIAHTVLYEGYLLYPYRPSALKNQQRWNFGTLYPPEYDEVRRGTERASMHVECLLTGDATSLSMGVRFLQLGIQAGQQEWNETVERSVEFTVPLPGDAPALRFGFPASGEDTISGSVQFRIEKLSKDLSKLWIDLLNQTPVDAGVGRDQALLRSLVSAHLILCVEHGEFVSLLAPPEHLRDAAAACKNIGCFPVLVGHEGDRDMLLCAPIILYDYPQIAPESAGDFFDGTEMDEMLTLRVLTLTPEEKQAMSDADERARALLERTEQSAREQLARLHGTVRSMRPLDES